MIKYFKYDLKAIQDFKILFNNAKSINKLFNSQTVSKIQ